VHRVGHWLSSTKHKKNKNPKKVLVRNPEKEPPEQSRHKLKYEMKLIYSVKILGCGLD
jgi:hypothetical protein